MAIENWMPCPDCDGYGYTNTEGRPPEDWPECPRCEGKSEIPADPELERAWKAAPGGELAALEEIRG